ncbi:hypothetical protein [Micromonospora chersina]|uniref:hypothetical protein n=1 Tax=Micromonospora chersina TaxID=47854 RepID=UPI0037193EBF
MLDESSFARTFVFGDPYDLLGGHMRAEVAQRLRHLGLDDQVSVREDEIPHLTVRRLQRLVSPSTPSDRCVIGVSVRGVRQMGFAKGLPNALVRINHRVQRSIQIPELTVDPTEAGLPPLLPHLPVLIQDEGKYGYNNACWQQ